MLPQGASLVRLEYASALVAAIRDFSDEVAFRDDPDRALLLVDDNEPVDVLGRHLPGRIVKRR